MLYRGVLYMINDSGVLTTLNAKTGEVFKQARLRGVSDKYFASPVAADGKIFFAGNSGVVAVLKAGGDQELLAANNLDEDIHRDAGDRGRADLRQNRSGAVLFRRK